MATEISIHPDALLDSRERQEFDEAAAERKQEKQSPAVEKDMPQPSKLNELLGNSEDDND
jgi:hypothetical protein